MAGRLSGKAAVVTGGGRGIGRAVALALAAEGAGVVINDLGAELDGSGKDTSVAATVVDEITSSGGKAIANGDSVATLAGAERIVGAALDEFKRLDILVNCAGNTIQKLPWDLTEDDWNTTIAVHLSGHFFCTRAASEPMRKQGSGRIIHITSHVGLYGLPDAANYCGAKAGVTGLTKSFAQALAPSGITVNAVAPSAISRMSDTVPIEVLRARAEAVGVQLPPEMPEEQIRLMLIGDPAAVANFITYLSLDEAKDVTGRIFAVIGGHIGVFAEWNEEATMDNATGIYSVDDLIAAVPKDLLQGALQGAGATG